MRAGGGSDRFNVIQDIPVPRLDGLLEVVVEASGERRDCRQLVRYRSFGAKRVHVRVDSTIRNDSHFTWVPSSDTLVADGLRWIHIGQTPSGSSKWQRRVAGIERASEQTRAEVRVVVEVRGDRPYAGKIVSDSYPIPLG